MVNSSIFLREDVVFLLKEEVRRSVMVASPDELSALNNQPDEGVVVSNSITIGDDDEISKNIIGRACEPVCARLKIPLKEVSDIASTATPELVQIISSEVLIVKTD
ncbi:MAG: hypothetical protein ACI9T9_001284 [Oleiphilaceae bacterium]